MSVKKLNSAVKKPLRRMCKTDQQ